MQDHDANSLEQDVQAVENQEVRNIGVDNDHTINDARTALHLDSTKDALSAEKKKRRSKPLLVLLLSVLMAAIGAVAGIIIYKAYFEKSPTATTIQSAQSVVTKKITAASVLSAVKPLLKGNPVETGKRIDATVFTADSYEAYSVPQLQPTNTTFTTVPAELTGVSTSSDTQSVIDADVLAAKKHLESNGLRASKNTIDINNHLIGSVDYVNDDIACTIATTNYANRYQSHIGCADMTSYQANARELRPLYTKYVTSDSSTVKTKEGLYMGKAAITNSVAEGYSRAQVSVGNINSPTSGSIAYFYQTPDKTWYYLFSSQDILRCADVPAGEARKAFAGESCTDASGNQSKVTP